MSSIDNINLVEKEKYKSFFRKIFYIQVSLAIIFLIMMIITGHLKTNGLTDILLFPFDVHIDFLTNVIGFTLTLLVFLFFVYLFIIHGLYETKDDGVMKLIFLVAVGIVLYVLFTDFFHLDQLTSNTSYIKVTEYWDSVSYFFSNPGEYIILTIPFYYGLEITSWIILGFYIYKNIYIYNQEQSCINYTIKDFKALLFLFFIIILFNILKSIIVIIIQPSLINYVLLLASVMLLNGVFENINASLSKYKELSQVKNKYKNLWMIHLSILSIILSLIIYIFIPDIYNSILIDIAMLKYIFIVFAILLIVPLSKFYYISNHEIYCSSSLDIKTQNTFAICLSLLIGISISTPFIGLIEDSSTIIDSKMIIFFFFALLFTLITVYFVKIFSTKEVWIFIVTVLSYFLFGIHDEILMSLVIVLIFYIGSFIYMAIDTKLGKTSFGQIVLGGFGLLFLAFLPFILNAYIFVIAVIIISVFSHYLFIFLGALFVKSA